jgi:hypothetical protein
MVVGLVLFLASSAVYAGFKRAKERAPQVLSANDRQAAEPDISETLHDAVASNSPLECTYSQPNGEEAFTAIVHTNGNNLLRVDINAGKQLHQIQNAQGTWIWGLEGKKGYQLPTNWQSGKKLSRLAPYENMIAKLTNPPQLFRCHAWAIDATLFVRPSSIVFTGLSY